MNYLRAIHLNDSKKELGSRVDRHDSIGKGFLGLDFFKKIMQDSNLNHIPFILETPDETLWAEEITLLHSLYSLSFLLFFSFYLLNVLRGTNAVVLLESGREVCL